MPHDGEVRFRAEVVGDSYRRVQVEDDVPVATGNKHSFTGVLNQFDLEAKQKRDEVQKLICRPRIRAGQKNKKHME